MASEAAFSLSGRRVWVAGHRGMVGSALVRRLASEDCEIVTVDRDAVDLTRQAETEGWIDAYRPEVVFLAASKVGGILANDRHPADFLYENLLIEANVMRAAVAVGVAKLLFLGSSCIYPRLASQPMAEEALLTGPLEPTNEAYAIAKIAGVKLAQAMRRQHGVDFICAMPTNLYGPEDNFDLQSSHVLPALIRKAHEAKVAGAAEMVVWGSGAPRREFLHVDDCADALTHMMGHYSSAQHLNVGSGEDIAIADLARLVCDVVGFEGSIAFDTSKPDGAPRKLLDVSRLRATDWIHRISLREGIVSTYDWFLRHDGRR
ncbi:MAG TPA: GDP-L-fucose synthase [Caulobacteraceae bacterium]